MTSPYLERPVRSLEQVLEERMSVLVSARHPEPLMPAAPTVNCLDSIGVLVQLLMSGRGIQGFDGAARGEVQSEAADPAHKPSPARGRRAA